MTRKRTVKGRKTARKATKAAKKPARVVSRKVGGKARKLKVADSVVTKSVAISYDGGHKCILEFTGVLKAGKPYVRLTVLKPTR